MAGKLKPLDVAREATPGKYADGDRLHFVVNGPTARSWSYRYWFKGKERWYGLGSFDNVSLSEARLARDAARLRVKGDRNTPSVDIVEEKRAVRNETKATKAAAAAVPAPTFEQCAETYIRKNWNDWSSKHRAQWPSSTESYAYPTIGKLTIAEIKPSHVFDILSQPTADRKGAPLGPLWLAKRETANRVRGRIETIIAANVDLDNLPNPVSPPIAMKPGPHASDR